MKEVLASDEDETDELDTSYDKSDDNYDNTGVQKKWTDLSHT